MSSWFESGRAVDIVLFVVAIELIALPVVAKWWLTDALLRLMPGACLLMALRGALTGTDWRWIALPLALSFPFHLADLARSARRSAAPSNLQARVRTSTSDRQ